MNFNVMTVDDLEQDGWYDELRVAIKERSSVQWDLLEEGRPGDIVLFSPFGADAPVAWGRVARKKRTKGSGPGRRWFDVIDLQEAADAAWPPYEDAVARPVVRIVDFGGSSLFEQAATATAENLRALLPEDGTNGVTLEIVRTTAASVVGEAIAEGSARLVHVMSHGRVHRVGSHLGSETGHSFSFEVLADHLVDRRRHGRGIGARILLLDACDSFRGDFPSQIGALLDHPMLYVGTTREVGFDEATCYFNALYASLVSMGLLGSEEPDVAASGLNATARADQAYQVLRGEASPFAARVLG